MRMRFMGPCRTWVVIAPEIVVGSDSARAAAWQALAEAVRADAHSPFVITGESFAHSSEAGAHRPVAYETVTDDTPMLPATVLDCQVSLASAVRTEILAAATRALRRRGHEAAVALAANAAAVPEEAHLRLYYGGTMIVWFDLGHDLAASSDLPAAEQLGMALLQAVATRVDAELVALFRRDSAVAAGLATVATEAVADEAGGGPALWVTRSLFVEDGEAAATDVLPAWLDPVSEGGWRDEMEREGFSMQWLRYAFDEAAMRTHGSRFADAWESMLFCQFFWSALERVERRMFALLGRINSASSPVAVRQSYAHLDRVREEAELTLAHHRHLKRYVTRERHRLINDILDGWGFQHLVENLHDIIGVARTRHEQLLQRAAARSSVFTDMLLFAIGSVAVLQFFVDLSVIGRQLDSDSSIGRRDEGWFDILGYFSSLRMDTVFSLATSFVLVVALILFWYRRRQLY